MAPLYSDKGRPGIASRFAIGLLLLKHMFGLSDERVSAYSSVSNIGNTWMPEE
jgi:hypothetical protein